MLRIGDIGLCASPRRAPLVRRAVAPGKVGTREGKPRCALSHGMRKIRAAPRPMRRFRKARDHNGEASAL